MFKAASSGFRVALMGVAFGMMSVAAHAQAQGNWVMKAPAPGPLAEVGIAAVDNKLHLFGGSILGYPGPHHLEYDPATDKWTNRAPFPNRLDHVGTATLNGKIYTMGGFIGGSVHNSGQNVAYEFDPKLNTWRILAPMKIGRGSVNVVAIDGKIHAIGGRDALGNTLTLHEVYDPGNNTWKDAAPLPKARDHAAAVAVDGKIYFAGGRLGPSTERSAQVDIYDAQSDKWTSGPPMPTPRSGLSGTYYKGLFLVLGGEFPQEMRTWTENEAYDIKANTWRTLAPMPSGRHATGAVTIGDHVYMAAGSLTPGGIGATNQTLEFTLP
jgi:hypothetical protein